MKRTFEKTKTLELAQTALLTALVAVSTMIIKMPIPITGGYIHPGDGLVILSGLCLGPVLGAFAAGFGSGLADLLSGYVIYMPATLVIKGISAWIAAIVWRQVIKRQGVRFKFSLSESGNGRGLVSIILAGFLAEAWMVLGYFLFESLLYNPQTAAAAMPFNGLQGLFGIIIACVLFPLLSRYTE